MSAPSATPSAAWHPDLDMTPTPNEVEMMASALEGRHGVHAARVASFFSECNAQAGDASRSWAWAAVSERVRRRTKARIGVN